MDFELPQMAHDEMLEESNILAARGRAAHALAKRVQPTNSRTALLTDSRSSPLTPWRYSVQSKTYRHPPASAARRSLRRKPHQPFSPNLLRTMRWSVSRTVRPTCILLAPFF
jgi:hypothetical protein